ncbi:choice-of-anchor M domain-containing protein [Jonesia quinghaiensis]|uniref:choice-of-anchor M domain-containing protein n=1 Tax=Jonesia quinghaiensis TaxID=262806 RepID=UPI0004064F70|nr:choice-of-anchor M domain-containing protein [Jonesia quinghaiensis]
MTLLSFSRLLVTFTTAGALAVCSSAGAFAASDDSDLEQTLDPDAQVVADQRVIDTGHVDLGPRFVDGEWQLLIHDDVARSDADAQSVWRPLNNTVLSLTDAATESVPDDPTYSFLGKDAGEPVWISPQTQKPGVVWIGWNTQDPAVMERIDRGITLSLRDVSGPGALSVYLQSGSSSAPQILWDSRNATPQPVWVDVNTHTHANWVFTEPGVYLVTLEAQATLLDGSTVSDVDTLRLTVGEGGDTQEAFSAQVTDVSPSEPTTAATDTAASPAVTNSGLSREEQILIIAIGVTSVALISGFFVVMMRSRRARHTALASTTTDAPHEKGATS